MMSRSPRPPIESADDRFVDLQRVQQRDRVASNDRRLTVTKRVGGQEARGSVAAQVRHDHPVAGRGQQRRHVDVAMNVVRPAVQKEDRRTVRAGRPPRTPRSRGPHRSVSVDRTRHSGGSVPARIRAPANGAAARAAAVVRRKRRRRSSKFKAISISDRHVTTIACGESTGRRCHVDIKMCSDVADDEVWMTLEGTFGQ